jgi:hypothetical protein
MSASVFSFSKFSFRRASSSNSAPSSSRGSRKNNQTLIRQSENDQKIVELPSVVAVASLTVSAERAHLLEGAGLPPS